MNQGKYVFSQLVSHLDRNHFNYLARKYDEEEVHEALFSPMPSILMLLKSQNFTRKDGWSNFTSNG